MRLLGPTKDGLMFPCPTNVSEEQLADWNQKLSEITYDQMKGGYMLGLIGEPHCDLETLRRLTVES